MFCFRFWRIGRPSEGFRKGISHPPLIWANVFFWWQCLPKVAFGTSTRSPLQNSARFPNHSVIRPVGALTFWLHNLKSVRGLRTNLDEQVLCLHYPFIPYQPPTRIYLLELFSGEICQATLELRDGRVQIPEQLRGGFLRPVLDWLQNQQSGEDAERKTNRLHDEVEPRTSPSKWCYFRGLVGSIVMYNTLVSYYYTVCKHCPKPRHTTLLYWSRLRTCPYLGVFIAGRLFQRGARIRQTALMLAKQAAALMIQNFRAYAVAPDVGWLAQERTKNERMDSLVIFQCFDELQKGQHSSLSNNVFSQTRNLCTASSFFFMTVTPVSVGILVLVDHPTC